MTKAERKLYLEYCKEIDRHNHLSLKDDEEVHKKLESSYELRLSAWKSLPILIKVFTPKPIPNWQFGSPTKLDPFIKEKSLAGFYEWLARREAVHDTARRNY